MEIPLNTQVKCKDGICGRSVVVLIDPVANKVTHVVVKEDGSDAEYIVPIESVTETVADTIRLSCSKAELEKMDPFIKSAVIEEKVSETNFAYAGGRMGMGIGSTYYLPYVSAERTVYESVEQKQIPPGELAVKRGDRVEATDGHVGKVDEFVVNPENGGKTHLVMREGHLWGKKDVIIPISAISDAHDDSVFLKLNKHQIESLPTFPLQRRWS